MDTPLTRLLGIKYPVMCAGMGYSVTTPELAAAVSNAGGIGSLAFIGFTPSAMRDSIRKLKSMLKPDASFGVDLVFPADPSKNPNARKVNKDYLSNDLDEIVAILIEERVPLLVCAIGVPERWICDALHGNGTVIMNMVGHPKHVPKAIGAGVDIICCQGSEGGGHTGSVASTILLPMCVDAVAGHKNYFGCPVLVVAAGGFYDGRGLAAALTYGASGVWMGTRFLMTYEANAEKSYKNALLASDVDSTVRSTVYSGRPMRVLRNKYLDGWENRQTEQEELIRKGLAPAKYDVGRGSLKAEHMKCMVGNGAEYPRKDSEEAERNFDPNFSPMLTGQAAGALRSLEHAGELVEKIVSEARSALRSLSSMSKL
jgi:NAD(P)H-dependent flavin oxidoreductase YrpB (nitropropane dioxygenase family)